MKLSKITQGLVIMTIASGAFIVGCELIVDFDRTQIPVEVSETSVPDSSIPETSTTDDGGDAGEAGATTDGGEEASTTDDAGDAGLVDAADQ